MLLPSKVKPVIVTNAGFRAPWFAYILKLGWDFVGRLRNKNLIILERTGVWALSSTYFKEASCIPNYIGQGLLTKEGKVPAQFVLYKKKSKGRHLTPGKKTCSYHQYLSTKNENRRKYYGLGLKNSLTRCGIRMNILLLIAAIATLAAWLAGLFIKNIGRHADFQVHSAKNTSVLSTIFLGEEL